MNFCPTCNGTGRVHPRRASTKEHSRDWHDRILILRAWGWPLKTIARAAGLKDHSCVIYHTKERCGCGIAGRRLAVLRRRSSQVLEEAAAKYMLTVEQMTGPSRMPERVEARDEAAYTLSAIGMGQVEIGKALGDREHSTIAAAVQRHVARNRGPA